MIVIVFTRNGNSLHTTDTILQWQFFYKKDKRWNEYMNQMLKCSNALCLEWLSISNCKKILILVVWKYYLFLNIECVAGEVLCPLFTTIQSLSPARPGEILHSAAAGTQPWTPPNNLICQDTHIHILYNRLQTLVFCKVNVMSLAEACLQVPCDMCTWLLYYCLYSQRIKSIN